MQQEESRSPLHHTQNRSQQNSLHSRNVYCTIHGSDEADQEGDDDGEKDDNKTITFGFVCKNLVMVMRMMIRGMLYFDNGACVVHVCIVLDMLLI
jgi:hypothetical protein